MFRDKKFLGGLAAASLIFAGVAGIASMGTAIAQLNNKPYSFRNSPGGGVGMSQGGRQAIIDEELFDQTPDNLQRGRDGRLVDIVEGPGNTAIIFRKGTDSSIPGFRGLDFRGDPSRGVGIFNSFFAPPNGRSFTFYSGPQFHSTSTINSWTINIVSGPGSYQNPNPVDSWTTFVNTLNKM